MRGGREGVQPRHDQTFLSDGWWSLTRPSSSHLTTASSSLARSTVPNSPFGFPKLPKPSTRSPGVNSWPVTEASESGGLLARSESGIAPACDRGGWEALRSSGSSGCEDPRITFVEPVQRYMMAYTALSSRGPRIALAASTDLFHWRR